MARVLVTTTKAFPEGALCAYRELLQRTQQDRFGKHTATEDPNTADLILFVEYDQNDPFLHRARHHELTRKYREKCFVVSERDYTFPFLPGMYTSVPNRWYRPDRMRSGFYLAMFPNPHVQYEPIPKVNPEYLFSFRGAFNGLPVREQLADLDASSARIVDTSAEANYIREHAPDAYDDPDRKDNLQRRYGNLLQNSTFVLCPRGLAPSTVRIFETLKAGRIPVIIADDWVPPEGPDWNACSVRIPEGEISTLPERLSTVEEQAPAMGEQARTTWEEWFAPEVSFHRIVNWCLDIQEERSLPESLLRLTAWWQLLHQPYRYNFYRDWKERRFDRLHIGYVQFSFIVDFEVYLRKIIAILVQMIKKHAVIEPHFLSYLYLVTNNRFFLFLK